jgi:superfamily II DNA helicase RecQ
MSGALGKNKTTIKKKLIQLQKLGIIDYIPATSQPNITFLKERPTQDDFLLHPDIYSKRKKSHLKQIQEVQKLLKASECNSKMVLTYFGQDSDSCGHCNHCINEKHKKSKINQLLLEHCTNKTTVASLMNLTGLSERVINKSMNEMINDELVSIENGWIRKL